MRDSIPGFNPGIPGLAFFNPEIPGLEKTSGIAIPTFIPLYCFDSCRLISVCEITI